MELNNIFKNIFFSILRLQRSLNKSVFEPKRYYFLRNQTNSLK